MNANQRRLHARVWWVMTLCLLVLIAFATLRRVPGHSDEAPPPIADTP